MKPYTLYKIWNHNNTSAVTVEFFVFLPSESGTIVIEDAFRNYLNERAKENELLVMEFGGYEVSIPYKTLAQNMSKNDDIDYATEFDLAYLETEPPFFSYCRLVLGSN